MAPRTLDDSNSFDGSDYFILVEILSFHGLCDIDTVLVFFFFLISLAPSHSSKSSFPLLLPPPIPSSSGFSMQQPILFRASALLTHLTLRNAILTLGKLLRNLCH